MQELELAGMKKPLINRHNEPGLGIVIRSLKQCGQIIEPNMVEHRKQVFVDNYGQVFCKLLSTCVLWTMFIFLTLTWECCFVVVYLQSTIYSWPYIHELLIINYQYHMLYYYLRTTIEDSVLCIFQC